MNWFKKDTNLSRGHAKELAFLTGGMALLVFIALGITASDGKSLLARLNTVAPSSLTASIFPCSAFADCGYASKMYYGLTANTTNVTTGQAVQLTWLAYDTNNFGNQESDACMIGDSRFPDNCYLSSYGYVGTPCIAGTQDNGTFGCANDGTFLQSPHYNAQTGVSYTGTPLGVVTVYPTVTTTYTFCGSSYYGTRDGSNFATYSLPTPCPSVTITVAATFTCPVSSFDSQAGNPTSYRIYNDGQGSINNAGTNYCVHNYNGNTIYIPKASAQEWNDFYNARASLNVGIVSY